MLFNAAILALATSASAWPLGRRQAVSSLLGEASSLLESATSAVAGSASAATPSSAASSVAASSAASSSAASSAGSSVASSASASASASGSSLALSSASPSASASIIGNTTAYGFQCAEGYYLTYAINRTTYDAPLESVTGLLSNWSSAVPPPGVLVTSNGTNETGATRTWTFNGVNISEQLANSTINETTGSLNQIWVTVSPIAAGGQNLTILNATESLTVYRNLTTNNTEAQYFINACGPTNQTEGRNVLYSLINTALTGFGTLASNSTGGASASSSVSSAAASSTVSSAASSSAISSAVSSAASSAASSAVSSVASQASGVASSAAGVATGIRSSAVGIISALTSAVAAAPSAAASAV